jgi:hypothetical protein
MRLRRLESEVIRDRILATSGKLDRTIGGPPVLMEHRPNGMVILSKKDVADSGKAFRRSLYVLNRRNYTLSFLNTFDQPPMTLNCTRRTSSAVVGQALFMLNDDFVLEQSRQFAERVAKSTGEAVDRRVERAFQLAFERRPTAEEAAWSRALLERRTAKYLAAEMGAESATQRALAGLCHVLLNTSEFLYLN